MTTQETLTTTTLIYATARKFRGVAGVPPQSLIDAIAQNWANIFKGTSGKGTEVTVWGESYFVDFSQINHPKYC